MSGLGNQTNSQIHLFLLLMCLNQRKFWRFLNSLQKSRCDVSNLKGLSHWESDQEIFNSSWPIHIKALLCNYVIILTSFWLILDVVTLFEARRGGLLDIRRIYGIYHFWKVLLLEK